MILLNALKSQWKVHKIIYVRLSRMLANSNEI